MSEKEIKKEEKRLEETTRIVMKREMSQMRVEREIEKETGETKDGNMNDEDYLPAS